MTQLACEHEIVEELSQHLDDRWRELIASGMPPDEATQLALADFREGNLLARYLAPLRQAHAPMPLTPGLPARLRAGNLWRDVSYAARRLRTQPGFAVAAIVTIALGIGATTAIFAVVDPLVLCSLPFPEADRLVQIVRAYPSELGASTSVPKFVRWRRADQHVFVDLAAYNDLGSGFNLVGSGTPERLIGSQHEERHPYEDSCELDACHHESIGPVHAGRGAESNGTAGRSVSTRRERSGWRGALNEDVGNPP